jgi:pimeloyl-ACP methyl ester carboxylesterase
MFTDVAVETTAARLTARDYGGTGRPIVLVHGLSSNLAIWDLVGPLLARHHRVVAYDQRSHGRSSDAETGFTFPELASDLAAVIDAFGLERPVVAGHSWGASVVLEHAIATPTCPGVVCIDGGAIDMQGLGRTWEEAEPLLTPPKLIGRQDEILERIRTEQTVIPWERLEPVVVRGRVATEDGLSRPRLSFDHHMRIAHELWKQRTWELYPRITCPVMLVLARGIERNNREQGFVAIKQLSAERVREAKPDVRIEWLDSVHDIPLYSPYELTELIADFSSTLD